MANKSKRQCIAEALEDLEKEQIENFIRQLLDRKEEPRVRRARVLGKSRLEIADILVSTFTEDDAVKITEELLKKSGCHEVAKDFVKDVNAQSAKPGSSGGAGEQYCGERGATGGGSMADEVHFVDKHRKELIDRVSNIASILDDLFEEKVIQQEAYDEIRRLPTTPKQMREIFSGCLKGGKPCKDIFYKSLEKNERFLMDDLKKK